MSLNSEDRVLVLGASSWLGYLLTQQLSLRNIATCGTVFKSTVFFDENVEVCRTDGTVTSYADIIKTFKPNVIINFLRGEDDTGFQIHKKIISLCKKDSIYYMYASSILALDAYKDTELVESLEASSISPYGIFKANCEQELYTSNILWSILRFASVQGWVAHKATRNQVFLEKLANKKEVLIDREIFQNRILASLLIEGILDLLDDRITGIIHFGAKDSSEEYVFMKQQAEIFGYDTDLFISGPTKNINLVAVPHKIYELYGDTYKVSENDTLQGLLEIAELNQIKTV